jgi:hypothetical protein
VKGLGVAGPVVEPRYYFSRCRGTLVFNTGQTEDGTISVTEREGPRILQVSWESDELARKRQAEQQEAMADAQRIDRSQQVKIEDRPAPIEKDAVLFKDSKAWLEDTQKMVRFTRANGFVCASVSASRPMLTSIGYVLVCNNFRYTYDIQDKGGTWQVSVR